MLAQNFKTPFELGITDAEFGALLKVLGMLERGELIDTDEQKPAPTEFGFFMGSQHTKHSCGALACIGGWVAILMRHPNPAEYVDNYMFDGALEPLYWRYPNNPHPTVDEAAVVLRAFLNTGEVDWGRE